MDTSGHHLVYGKLKDYLTGEELRDTDDERYRQQLARFMVEDKGYKKEELIPRLYIETNINNQYVRSVIELTVQINNKAVMIIRYAPGSLVTRERPAIAAARLLEPAYRIPLAVVTNTREAELLETYSGKVLATGMESIPDRQRLKSLFDSLSFEPFVEKKHRDKEARILNVYDVEVCCRENKCIQE